MDPNAQQPQQPNQTSGEPPAQPQGPTPTAQSQSPQFINNPAPTNFAPQNTYQQPANQQPQSAQKTDVLGLLSIILGLIMTPIVGLILGLIGNSKAKKEGYSNSLSKIGIIVNIVLLVIGVLVLAGLLLLASNSTPEESTLNEINRGTNLDIEADNEAGPATDDSINNDTELDTDVSINNDTIRKNDINSIYQKLEEYYNEYGGYPDGELSATVLAGISPQALLDSNDVPVQYANGFTTSTLTSLASVVEVRADSQYQYIAFECDAEGPQEPVGASCQKYFLSTYLESETPAVYSKSSLN